MRVRTNRREYPHVTAGLKLVHYSLGLELVRFPFIIDKTVSNLTSSSTTAIATKYRQYVYDYKQLGGYFSS
jgi:hypothetical protein